MQLGGGQGSEDYIYDHATSGCWCHQAVKLGSVRLDDATMARRVQWLKAIQEWQEEFVDSLSAREFVDCILDDLLGQSVFVFTPSGDLLRLPKVCNRTLLCHANFV